MAQGGEERKGGRVRVACVGGRVGVVAGAWFAGDTLLPAGHRFAAAIIISPLFVTNTFWCCIKFVNV